MRESSSRFQARLARDEQELRASHRLRYEVFVEELGGDGTMVDHSARLERDRFDAISDHLLLIDTRGDAPAHERVVGVYRLLRDEAAREAGQFYSEDEYDLGPLRATGRRLLELGRSCLHPDYRGGPAMFHLWSALAEYVAANRIEILFGVASFHGTALDPLRAPLSLLHYQHLAPPALRVRARSENFQRMDLIPEDAIDRRAAMLAVPSLIKAYLRLGGVVGEGAYVDHAFNTTDVCLIMDTHRLNEKQKRIYMPGERV